MSDVTITIGGKDEDAQKAWDRQQREIAKLKEKIADLNKVIRKGGEEGKKSTEGHTESLAKMAMGMVSVGSAVSTVVAAYDKWHERMRSIAIESNKFHSELLKNLNRAGDLASGAEIKAALRSIPGAKQEEANAAFKAVSDSAPQSDLQRRLGVVNGVARMAPISDVTALGGVAGELSDIMPGVKPEDIADLAVKMQEQAGGDAEKLGSAKFLKGAQTLAATGATDMHGALALGTEALRQNMDPRLVDKVGIAVGSNMEKIKGNGRALTPDERMKNQFAAMNPTDRLNALMTNQKMAAAVMDEGAAQHLAQITPDAVKRLADEQRSAMAGDEVGKRLGDAAAFDPATFAQRDADIRVEQIKHGLEEETRSEEVTRTDRTGNALGKNFLDAANYEGAAWAGEAVGGAKFGNSVGDAAESASKLTQGPAVAILRDIYTVLTSKKAVVKGGEQ